MTEKSEKSEKSEESEESEPRPVPLIRCASLSAAL